MTKPSVLSVDQALERLASEAQSPVSQTQLLSIENSVGHIIASDVHAKVDAPPADNSAMDGFAINSADLSLDSDTKISQRIAAGDVPKPLEKGTAARVFTGAYMPENADTVVIQENCTYDEASLTVHSERLKQISSGQHVRKAGSDIGKGDLVLPARHKIRPQDIGLLITSGIQKIEVFVPLKVAVIATGSELVDISQPLAPGTIYESNSPMIATLVNQMGCIATRYRTPDTLEATKKVLSTALLENDVAITIGGVSVGEEDHVQAALNSIGKTEFWKINMKPGKPFLFGQASKKLVMGLPGNPVSAFVTFNLFCRPVVGALAGSAFQAPRKWLARAAFETTKTSDRQDYLRGQSRWEGGQRTVTPVGKQLSSMQGSLCAADVLIVVPPETLVTKGQLIEVISITDW